MERLQDSHGVTVQWHAFELRPAGAPPISPEYRAKIEESRPRLNAIAQEQYGLTLNPGPFGGNSRPALEAAKWAEAQGKGAAFHAHVMSAYWESGKDISDATVLGDIAQAVGLDRDVLDQVLGERTYQAEVDADVALAQQLGLNSVPAMVFAEKYLVAGAQPYSVLTQVVEKIAAEDGSEDDSSHA